MHQHNNYFQINLNSFLVVSELQEHISASTMVFEVEEEKSDGKKIIDEILENKSSTDRGVKTEKTEG